MNKVFFCAFLFGCRKTIGQRQRKVKWKQMKTCRKKFHVKIDNMKELLDLICGKVVVGGNYNSTCDYNTRATNERFGVEHIK